MVDTPFFIGSPVLHGALGVGRNFRVGTWNLRGWEKPWGWDMAPWGLWWFISSLLIRQLGRLVKDYTKETTAGINAINHVMYCGGEVVEGIRMRRISGGKRNDKLLPASL